MGDQLNKVLTVDLGEASYPIHIGAGLIADVDLFTAHIRGQKLCIVSNETIAPLYLASLKSALEDRGFFVSTVILRDGESFKTLQTLNLIFDVLLEEKHGRDTTLIALGGGVVGDMTGFAAASYQRGVDFIQVPTTLLSQVDSSVGGKTGVNHPLGKNMIGAFYQPRLVVIDTDVLDTLPNRELSAGVAEVIKYGLIRDLPFLNWLEKNIAPLMAGDKAIMTEAIYRSCENKAAVVAEDEKEGGVRAILNLGHTFGHAIEAEQGYGEWLHGEAVAAGMVMAAQLSHLMGRLSEEEVQRVVSLLKAANLPVNGPEGMSVESYMERMAVDKKALAGTIRFILLEGLGQAFVTSDYPPELLRQVLENA